MKRIRQDKAKKAQAEGLESTAALSGTAGSNRDPKPPQQDV
jgi:hypothetical protein